MGWFGTKVDAEAEVKRLNEEIAGLEVRLDAKQKAAHLEKELDVKKRQLMDLEQKLSRLEEEHAKHLRELEHMTGLRKAEFDQKLAHAEKDAVLAVREENLNNEKTAWDKQMKFQKDEFDRQRDSLETLMQTILSRLPNVNYNIEEQRGHAPNGGATQAPAIEQSTGATPRRRSTTRKTT